MELQEVCYDKAEYVETASGNKVSRQTTLCGSQNIILLGKVIVQSNAIVRGDLANVRTGRYCIISKNSVIRPPYKKFSHGSIENKNDQLLSLAEQGLCDAVFEGFYKTVRVITIGNYIEEKVKVGGLHACFRVAFFPMRIGDHVFIGENSVVNAADVGSYVYIGKNVVIGRRCILKDCSMIADGTILPPETVVPSFAKYGGSPGVHIGELPECTQELMIDYTRSYYQYFIPHQSN